MGLNDGHTQARMGYHVTKLISLHSFHTKNIPSKFHQNLMNQIRDILEDVYFGPDYHNCPAHFCPFCPFSREPDFSWTFGFCRMIKDHFHFKQKKYINGLDFCQNSKKSIFRPFSAIFPKNQPNQIFPEKSGSVTF